MRGLPAGESTVGLKVVRKDKSVRDSILDLRPLTARVWITMVNGDGEMVINEGGPLNEWVWSGRIDDRHASYVYLRGKDEDVRINETTTRVKRLGMLADDGWGTYFSPRRWETYRLTIEVLKADENASNFEVELLIDRVWGGP